MNRCLLDVRNQCISVCPQCQTLPKSVLRKMIYIPLLPPGLVGQGCTNGNLVLHAGCNSKSRPCSLLVLSRLLLRDGQVDHCLCDGAPTQVANHTPLCWVGTVRGEHPWTHRKGSPKDLIQSFHVLFDEKTAATKQFAQQTAEHYVLLPHFLRDT